MSTNNETREFIRKNYFNEEESRDTLYLVFDLVKKSLNEGKISRKLINDILNLISFYYIDNFNRREFEHFLDDPTYLTKEHLIFPGDDEIFIKYLTFLFLIHIYTSYIYLEAKILLEKEIIMILIQLIQNKIEEKKVLDFFKFLDKSLIQLKSKQIFIDRISFDKKLQLLEEFQICLFADFFFDYLNENKRPELSLMQLKKMLTALESKLNDNSNISDLMKHMEYLKKD